VIRAGRNLDIYGSINDGFAPPPPTPDDNGWVLTPGRQAYGGDVVVPGPGVVLADGTLFPNGKTAQLCAADTSHHSGRRHRIAGAGRTHGGADLASQ